MNIVKAREGKTHVNRTTDKLMRRIFVQVQGQSFPEDVEVSNMFNAVQYDKMQAIANVARRFPELFVDAEYAFKGQSSIPVALVLRQVEKKDQVGSWRLVA